MKHIFITTYLLILTLYAGSQTFNPGSSRGGIDDIKNKFYLRGGISTPAWKYYGYSGPADLKKYLGVESKIGANFEIGTIFMINSLDLGRGVRLGVDADYLSFKAHVFNLPGTENIYNLFIGSKLGPSLTIMPERGLSFDFYAKLCPVWVGAIYYNQQNYDDGLDAYLGYVQLMYSFGFNVQVAFFLVGFEYEIGSMSLKNNSGEYWGDFSDPKSKKTPMPGFNLTVGLSF